MPQAIFAYHLGMDAEQYAFFRIPKLLITEPYFRRLSTNAKLLYGLMLDRMSLSMRNGWMDDDGYVYIYFTLEEACEQLCCKTDKAVKLFAELDSAKGVGLIRRVKQGLGRPAKIYVLRFNLPKIGRVDSARFGQTLTRPAPFLACRIDSLSEQLLIHGFASDCVLSVFILYAYSLHSR